MDRSRSYFEGRAEEELQLAEQAEHPSAVKSHYLLAELYLEQLYGEGGGVLTIDRGTAK